MSTIVKRFNQSRFCNGLPGLATAFADRSPVVCITSSPPLRDAETNALQGFHDQVVLAKPVTKFAHRFTTPLEIPRIVSLAWRTASSGAPGPVLLDFPIDILFTPVDDLSRVAWGNITGPAVSLPGPDPASISKLAQLVRNAERPAIVVGTGARGVSPHRDPKYPCERNQGLKKTGRRRHRQTLRNRSTTHLPQPQIQHRHSLISRLQRRLSI